MAPISLSDQENIAYLIEIARQMDMQYPQRQFVALGHSGSWLVTAIGMLRQSQGRPRNTGYIPFTGKHYRFDSEDKNAGTVSFLPQDIYTISQDSLDTYFNHLAKSKMDAPSLASGIAKGGEKPILIEMAFQATGLASFADSYNAQNQDGQQGQQTVQDTFDIIAFKPFYEQEQVLFDYPSYIQRGRNNRFCVNIITGPQACFLNMIAGAQGKATDSYNEAKEQDGARFMPYYTVIDGYAQDGYLANHTPSECGFKRVNNYVQEVRAMKQDIAKLLKRPENCPDLKEMAQAAERNVVAVFPKPRVHSGWIPYFRGPHG